MPGCIQWGVERTEACVNQVTQSVSTCVATRDDGYKNCCTWWPCSWLCTAWTWLSHIVCIAWSVATVVVCLAWTWVTTPICMLWDAVVTVVSAVIVLLESTIGWFLSAIAAIVEWVLAIPLLGAIVRTVLNLFTHLLGWYLSAYDAVAGLLGIRPEKKLRVCTVILRDMTGAATATVPFVVSLLQLAATVYKRDANVRLVPNQPFRFSSGFVDAVQVDASWIRLDTGRSNETLLDPRCNVEGFIGDFGLPGMAFQEKLTSACLFNAWRRLIGYGAPVAIFMVRTVNVPGPGGDSQIGGCATWIVDFGTVPGDVAMNVAGASAIAHELGHACNLWHRCVNDDPTNLMADFESCTPPYAGINFAAPRMDTTQALAVRASKHVTYF